MTTQQKIRSVRSRLAELMRMRKPTVLVDSNDPIERECVRLAGVLEKWEAQWKTEKARIDEK